MANITDLHLRILKKVFGYFCFGLISGYSTIQEFKQMLPPAAVCRVWRECMLPYVYYRAHLEYHVKEADKDSETTLPEYEWKSNIDLIVAQWLSSVIKELRIESFECPHNFTDMIHALDAFGFSSSHWRAVNILNIHTYDNVAVDDNPPISSDNEAMASQLTEYFGQHLPNIGDLSIYTIPQSVATRLLSNSLVNLYIRQLHTLHCRPAPINFICHSFSSSLRSLTVRIAPGVTNRLPQLLASPLEWLELFDIPHSFAWRTFIGIAPGHIEFTNLTYLRLEFRKPSENTEEPNNSNMQVSTITVSLNIGCRKLFFPKLRKLRILNSPYNDGALYSMFVHSPLQTVLISSSFRSVQHMDPHILSNATDVHFGIHSVSPDDYHDYAGFCCNLLRTPSNAKVAKLGTYQSSMAFPIPNTIEWINLEYLYLADNIHLASVIQVITQLPKLHTLGVVNIVDEINEAGAHLQAILEGRLAQMLDISTNVKCLSIYSLPTSMGAVEYSPSRLPLVFSLDIMRYLTVLIQSLDEVIVPDLYVSDIKEFAVRYANAFPRLHDIKVQGESEERGR